MRLPGSDGNNEYYIVLDRFADLIPLRTDDGMQIEKNGKPLYCRLYKHIKGTHQMNSKEMSRIIDSVVFDAEERGIPTKNQQELDRLLKQWERDHG